MTTTTRTLLTAITTLCACSGPEINRAESPLSRVSLVAPAKNIEAPATDSPTVEIIDSEIEPVKQPAADRPGFVRVTTPLFEDAATMQLTRTVWVKATPTAGGARLGLISSGTRIAHKSHVNNDDCETPWIEVEPRGYACVEVEPSDKPVTDRRERKRALIGRYAIAAKGAVFYKSVKAYQAGTGRNARGDMFRIVGSAELEDGTRLVKTERGEYIESSSAKRLWGSKWEGVDLRGPDAPKGPIAFAVHRRNPRARVVARREPDASARVSQRLKPRQVVSVIEWSRDNRFARVGDRRWVAREDLRVVDHQPALPEGVSGKTRWADVDLDQQLAVIYEGRAPIFATLVSSGRKGHETPTGVFRVTRKKVRTTMRSDRSRRQSYSVAVPWSTYFNEGYAFHTAYWHGSFGKPASHGCVNLSPSDALTVYQLLGPELPAGWSVVYGNDKHQPGSVVRVRSATAEAEAEAAQLASR